MQPWAIGKRALKLDQLKSHLFAPFAVIGCRTVLLSVSPRLKVLVSRISRLLLLLAVVWFPFWVTLLSAVGRFLVYWDDQFA